MKKRKDPEEESSSYSWMDTYGDMVTLLLCFFVLLYSFSSVDAGKWKELVGAFKGSYQAGAIAAFDESTVRQNPINNIDSMVDYSSRNTEPENNVQEQINESFDELYQQIKTFIAENGMQDNVTVSRTDEAIFLRFNEMALFAPGQAEILPGSKQTFEYIMQIIHISLDSLSEVKIEGHTDNVPIHTAEFSDNWDLSVKRATNTLRLVLATGLIPENKLSAVGYGEQQPIASNDTVEGRAKNRRVDFVLLKAVSDA